MRGEAIDRIEAGAKALSTAARRIALSLLLPCLALGVPGVQAQTPPAAAASGAAAVTNAVANVVMTAVATAVTTAVTTAAPAPAASRELVVGSEVDFPPFALGASDVEAGGFTVELFREVAQEMRLKHHIRVRPFGELLQEFRDGRIDVLINLAQSPQRAAFAEFSVPNVVAYGALFARKDAAPFATEAEAMRRSIIVLRADLAHDYAQAAGYSRLVPVDSVSAGMKLLAAGQHDGMLVSRLAGLMTTKELGLRDIVPVGEPVRGVVQRFSFAVRRGDGELLAQLNEGLALARTNGSFQRIYERWFAPIDPRPPSAAELARYLVPAAALVLLSFSLFLYQRRVSARAAEAARALADSAGTLKQAQQVAHLGNWTWRRDREALQWSDEMRRLHGLDGLEAGAAVSPASFLEATRDGERQALAARLESALRGGLGFEMEYRLHRADGSECVVHHRVEPVADNGAHLVGTVLDITARKRAEMLQFDQRRLLERIAEGVPLPQLLNAVVESLEAQVPGAMGGVLLVDDSGQALAGGAGAKLPAAYRAGLEGLRIGPSEGSCGTACHRHEPVIVSDIATDPLWDAYRDFAAAHGIRACWSQPIVGASGKVLGALSLSHGRPLAPQPAELQLMATQAHIAALAIERRRAEEELARMNASLEVRVAERTAQLADEVAERRRAEGAAAAAREFLDTTLNALRDAVFVKDREHRWVLLNDAACALIGRPRSELMGRSDRDVFGDPHVELAWAMDDAVLASGQDRVYEQELSNAEGRRLWIQVKKSRYVEPGGRMLLVGMSRDISERKHSEIELRAAKEAAESAAHAKSQFLANMSHEIRTPLHGVLGAMEMLGDTPLTGRQQRFIETARTSAGILLGVIDEILDYSRLEGGKLHIETLDFELHRTVEDVSTVLAQRAHAKAIELACYIAPEVPHATAGDPVRLRQVLVNLIGNAIKFTERGEVVVSCSARDDAQRGCKLLLVEVRDTGIGIPLAKQPLMFQPFTQADNSTSRHYGGSGLGLSITRRLVELMGGRIGLDSEEGRGSRFWFELPLQPALAGARSAHAVSLAGTRVLVIGNNATQRAILHRYLSSWRVHCGSAAGGAEALAKLQDAALTGQPYELVLLDLNMSGRDGYSLLAGLLADPCLATLPVIMLGSSAQDPVRMRGLRVDIWLDKPVRQSDLHDAIATVLGRQRAAPALAPPPPQPPAFGGERVLLAEDNLITRELGLQMLRTQGLAVDIAEDGAQAVERVMQQGYDVVLMDVQMPGVDGFEATRRIRRWELEQGRARVPIIALTAHALPADRERCLAAGMDDYVVKPYRAASVAAVISRWLMPPGHSVGAGAAVIDAERLQEVRAVMHEEFPKLMLAAARAMEQLAAQVRLHAEQQDRVALRDAVHRIRNTAGDVGANRLRDVAGELERRLDSAARGDIELAALAAEARAAALALHLLGTPEPGVPHA